MPGARMRRRAGPRIFFTDAPAPRVRLRRVPREDNGLGPEYRKAADALKAAFIPGKTACWRCGRPIASLAEHHAGHRKARALGGTLADGLADEHEHCNTSHGAKLGALLRGRTIKR